jgi:hypothetical protein|nr:MAG TPA: hypothetical protein [Caudoviricetes sp.]
MNNQYTSEELQALIAGSSHKHMDFDSLANRINYSDKLAEGILKSKLKISEYDPAHGGFFIQPLESRYAPVNPVDAVRCKTWEAFTQTFRRGAEAEAENISRYLLGGVPIIDATHEKLTQTKNNENPAYQMTMFNLCRYREPGTTGASNVIETSAVLVDIDGTDKPTEYILQAVDSLGVDALVVSSMRDKVGTVKVHIILPTTQPIKTTDTYKRTWKAIADTLKGFGIDVDPQVKDMTRRMYVASSLRVMHRTITNRAVVPLDKPTPEEIAQAERRQQWQTQARQMSASVDDIDRAIMTVATAPDGTRNSTLNNVLYRLKRLGASEKDLHNVAMVSNVETDAERRATYLSATGYTY